MAHDVFISYDVEDKSVADEVFKALEDGGVRCWYAPRDVPYGAEYEEAIVDAISVSKLMVLILSSHSNNSPHVKREVQNACREEPQVPVLPFLVENITPNKFLRYYIGSVNWLSAVTPPLADHLQRLVNYVKARLPQDAPDRGSRKQGSQPAKAKTTKKDEVIAGLRAEIERQRREAEKGLHAEQEQRLLAEEGAARRAAEERREEEEKERTAAEESQRRETEEATRRRAAEEKRVQADTETRRHAAEQEAEREAERRRLEEERLRYEAEDAERQRALEEAAQRKAEARQQAEEQRKQLESVAVAQRAEEERQRHEEARRLREEQERQKEASPRIPVGQDKVSVLPVDSPENLTGLCAPDFPPVSTIQPERRGLMSLVNYRWMIVVAAIIGILIVIISRRAPQKPSDKVVVLTQSQAGALTQPLPDNPSPSSTPDVALQDTPNDSDNLGDQKPEVSRQVDEGAPFNKTGDGFFKDRKYDKAAAEYGKAVNAAPQNPTYHNNLGLALIKQKNFSAAEAHYLEAMNLDQSNPRYHSNLATAQYRQGKQRFAEAEEHYRRALELAEGNRQDGGYLAQCHNNLGDALRDQGKNAEAEVHFSASVKLEPKSYAYHNDLGTILYRQNKYTDAADEHLEALKHLGEEEKRRRGNAKLLKDDKALYLYYLGNDLREQKVKSAKVKDLYTIARKLLRTPPINSPKLLALVEDALKKL
jgi:Flp pilus assembly protein TadD